MSLAIVHRATALGLALVLMVAGTAFADQLRPDADALDGVQAAVDLGEVAPGSAHGRDVSFALTCQGQSHLAAGASLAVYPMSTTSPGDGSMSVADGLLHVPALWPADGADCTGGEPVATSTPAHVSLTAPTAPGLATFDVLFALDSDPTVTNTVALTIRMTVVAPPAVDDTPPVIGNVPADITVATDGTSTAVSWATPTATDDTDPSPSVACDPASGSQLTLGATTVTCTATDATGNTASATFSVTVEQAAPDLTGTWGRPLGAAFPALVGHAGRTIPLKLDVRAGEAVAGPGAIAAPTLMVARLDSCAASAVAATQSPAGMFAWGDGAWQLNLDTSGLGSGCVRVAASVDGSAIAAAVIQLVPDATASKSRR